MAITRYQPWSVLSQFQNELNRLYDETAGPHESSSATAQWVPPVDIDEHPDRFVLYADVPGVAPDSIEITLENGVLTISGTREFDVSPAKEENVRRRSERAHGHFHRRFTLPDTVEADGVEARGRDGVLEIVIPKRAQSRPRKIEVKH